MIIFQRCIDSNVNQVCYNVSVLQKSEVWINEVLPHVLYELWRKDEGIIFLLLLAGSFRGECLGHVC